MRFDSQQIVRAARHLALAGGLLILVLAPALLLLQTPVEGIELGDFTGVLVEVVLGIVLIVAAKLMEASPLTTVVLAFIASLALLILGGTAGLIGGLFGLAGALLGGLYLLQDLLGLRG